MNEDREPSAPRATLAIYDFSALHFLQMQASKLAGEPCSTRIPELNEVIADGAASIGFGAPTLTYAPAAVDTRNDGQSRFVTAVQRQGIAVDPIDYRHAFVSNPGGAYGERPEKPATSLAPWITYAIGLMARSEGSSVIMVSGSFEPYAALLDLVRNRGGRACVAFVRRYLDARYSQFTDLLSGDGPVRWLDLTAATPQVFGAYLGSPDAAGRRSSTGLDAIP